MECITIPKIRETPRLFLGKSVTVSALLLAQNIVTLHYSPKSSEARSQDTHYAYWHSGEHAREHTLFRAYLVDVPWENATSIVERHWEKYVWSDVEYSNTFLKIFPLLKSLAPLREWLTGQFTRDAIWIDDDRLEETMRQTDLPQARSSAFFVYQLPVRITGTLRRANLPEMQLKIQDIRRIEFVAQKTRSVLPQDIAVDLQEDTKENR
jgi:hypothetical protein